jgi:hypothetical protein
MMKILTVIAALTLIVVGLIVLPMPIPLGALMIVSGLVLLISASAAVALRLKVFRRHHGSANKFIQAVADNLPKAWKRILRRTDP